MAELTYLPRKDGFKVQLISGELELVASGTGPDDANPSIEGSPSLLGNVSLVTLVLGYAANELGYRRSRSPEKRAGHREAAGVEYKDALALADFVTRLGDKTTVAWCSGCFSQTTHRHVQGSDRPKRLYLCQECGTPTVDCGVPRCSHRAVIRPRARIRFSYCAEHRHAIPSFKKLDAQIPTLGDYRDFLKHEAVNAERIAKVTGGTIGAAAVIAPLAFFAAPALGAALGGSVFGGSLTGAAAMSHGLAMLGGGAVASGGLGMAGGTAVVTATGTALGGALGAATVSSYVGDDSSFKIEQVRAGSGTPVVFATGFLTEGQSAWSSWQRLIDTRYPDSPVYQVHWGAKELRDLTALVTAAGAKAAVRTMLLKGARRGSKAAGIPGMGLVMGVHELATNPWTVAKTRAGMTGATLADLIVRSAEGPYVLMGHSLGARVMLTAAQALGTRSDEAHIEAMHLLGAAVGKKGHWHDLSHAVRDEVWNYWSENDAVLQWVYRLAEGGEAAVGQRGFDSKRPGIKDRNVSRLVAGHSEYIAKVTLQKARESAQSVGEA
jgi:pimeloyl-ACP methyl ester carboxylesterase